MQPSSENHSSRMNLSGAAWSFVGASLRESVEIYRALGIDAIDLLAVPSSLTDPAAIIADPLGEAAKIRNLGILTANVIVSLGSNFSDRALNHPDPAVRARNRHDFEAVATFCQAASIPSITALPGVDQQAWSHGKSLEIAAEVLNDIASICSRKGVRLLFEAHVQSVLESPAEVLRFLTDNPALGLTLDYAHFIYQGHTQADVDALAPFAKHVHLRQAAPGMMQAPWEAGAIDFAGMMRVLERTGFAGYLTLEYEHDEWLDNNKVDVISETIKMRNAVKPLLSRADR
jgi:sugar phosphate isomerase/epimerase